MKTNSLRGQYHNGAAAAAARAARRARAAGTPRLGLNAQQPANKKVSHLISIDFVIYFKKKNSHHRRRRDCTESEIG